MKKTLLILAALTVLAQAAFPQGSIVFINRAGSSTAAAPGQTQAPIYYADPADNTHRISGNTSTGIPAGNTSYGASLFLNAGTGGGNWIATLWGIESSQFTGTAEANNLGLLVNSVGVNSTTFRTAPPALFNGVVNQPSQPMLVPGFATDGTDGGKRATFQMRVWDTTGGIDTWAKVLTSPGTFRGYSDVFTVPYPLGGTLSPANTPPFLQGLTSFNVFTVVPEPSVIALGVLGAGCLFLLRRRK